MDPLITRAESILRDGEIAVDPRQNGLLDREDYIRLIEKFNWLVNDMVRECESLSSRLGRGRYESFSLTSGSTETVCHETDRETEAAENFLRWHD